MDEEPSHQSHSAQGGPGLLGLPGELRNRIYGYALTSSTGIKMRWQKGIKSQKPKPSMFAISEHEPNRAYSINQLQYVNRQLHRETAGWEVKYNRVTFACMPKARKKADAITNFYRFLYRCTPTKRLWLNRVFIAQEPDLSVLITAQVYSSWIFTHSQDLIALLKLCITNQHIQVDYQMPYFTLEPLAVQTKAGSLWNVKNFISIGVSLLWIFRGVHLQHVYMEHQTTAEFSSQCAILLGNRAYDSIRALSPRATKLRIFPKTADLATCLEKRRSDWRQLAYTWAKDGI